MFKIWVIFFFCVTVTFGKTNVGNNQYGLLETVNRGFNEYLDTKIRPIYLNKALSQLPLPNFFRENLRIGNTVLKEVHQLKDDAVCGLCNSIASFVVNQRKSGMTRTQLKAEVVAICDLLRIDSHRVCDETVDMNIDIILYLIDNNPDVTPGKFCDIVLQEFGCNYTNIDWTIDVPEGQSPARPKPKESSSFKILHITDVHMDTMYTPKKVKTCDEPVCCQSDQEDGYEGNSCGFWAEYGNDVSENLIDEMIRFANTLEFDYVYFTGDIMSHRTWTTNAQDNAAHITKFLTKLKDGFKVPVYPILGNHEPSPLNQYEFENKAPSNLSTQWLYDLIEKEWSQWLPNSATETISKGGFYTITPRDGFRLIVLNSNVAYKMCWWLLENEKDPYDQLDWLVSILSQAEEKDERVHILGHIPTGQHDVLRVWSREYHKIINRFANTITGQFNGHTHLDQFQVHYNISNPYQAINVAWNGASLVTAEFANPSFKIYTVDEETFDVIDIDEWTFNLTLANEQPDEKPEWYNIYSFRDAYNVPTLQANDIGNLLLDMAINHSRLVDYHLFRYRNSEPGIAAGCNQDCQKDYLCEMSTYIPGDKRMCDVLKTIYDETVGKP